MELPFLWLTPFAVLAVLLLFRYVGCQIAFPAGPEECEDLQETLYPGVVGTLSPIAYWRMQETSPPTPIPGGTMLSQTGVHAGTLVQGQPLPDDPAALSPPANPLRLELGVSPGLLQTVPAATSMRVQGSGILVPFDAALNPSTFTVVALVEPEWPVNDPARFGRYYCVIESSDQPALGSTASKTKGFALYAGPEDPALPNTPFRWQLWVGDGTRFRQLKEQDPQPDGAPTVPPLVENAATFLCIQFDGTIYSLYYYTPGRDIDNAKYFLVPPSSPYLPNDSGELSIGITLARKSLIAPFPGPDRRLYPFAGKIQEVVLYNRAIGNLCVIHHGMGAFTS
ncbi:MAG: LamG domain-containing protein [Gemmatimonadota bacterium]|nr:LamG domain-containing protein [Gemmatimonadota bacterium]